MNILLIFPGLIVAFIILFYYKHKIKLLKIEAINKVHFYVARDKDGELWLYIGKPVRELYVFKNDKHSITLVSSEDFSQYGLNEHDYDYLKWEDEPVEVFLNLGD